MTPDEALADVRAERADRTPDNPVEAAHAHALAVEVERLRALDLRARRVIERLHGQQPDAALRLTGTYWRELAQARQAALEQQAAELDRLHALEQRARDLLERWDGYPDGTIARAARHILGEAGG